jgi:hypothetical protein
MSALDELLNYLPDEDEMDLANRLIRYRAQATAELAQIKSESEGRRIIIDNIVRENCKLRESWIWTCTCGYQNNTPVCTHCGKSVTTICSENSKLRATLKQVVAVLCETRKHKGKRPCKFCYDLCIPKDLFQ